jgi:hypothetical protein
MAKSDVLVGASAFGGVSETVPGVAPPLLCSNATYTPLATAAAARTAAPLHPGHCMQQLVWPLAPLA